MASDLKPTQDSYKQEIHRSLTALDATSIIIGTIIGAAIFMLPSLIASQTTHWAEFLLAWVIGGGLAFMGALCYAELSTTYSEDGGDYVYLKKSFGRYFAFQFAWVCGWIFRPANIAAMAITFATFFNRVIPAPVPEQWQLLFWSFSAVSVLAAINLLGIGTGKWTQNVLTFCKIGGLTLFIVLAFSWIIFGQTSQPNSTSSKSSVDSAQVSQDSSHGTDSKKESKEESKPAAGGNVDSAESDENGEFLSRFIKWFSAFFLALVFVMYTFGGWNDVVFVAGEIENPRRNLPLSLMAGLGAVTIIYMLVNIGLLMNLGLEGIQEAGKDATSKVVAIRSQGWGLESYLPILFNGMVGISCLGAIAAMLITSPRLYFAAAKDHQIFSIFGTWNKEAQSPTIAIIGQWAATIVLLLVVSGIANLFLTGDVPGKEPFDELVAVSSPFFWAFLGLVGISVIVLRFKDPKANRPFLTWFYPVTPIIFSASAFFMFYSSVNYAYSQEFFISSAIVLTVFVIGLVIGFFPGTNKKGS